MKYTALMFDIVDSRNINNRKTAQKLIIEATNYLNKCFLKVIKRNVEFTTGDELQGLFYCPAQAYLYYRLLAILIHPIKIRAGIGVGNLDIYDEEWNTNKLDGECYHNARKAIVIAKNRQDVVFCDNGIYELEINSFLNAITIIKEKISFIGWLNALIYELYFPITSDEIEFNDYYLLEKIIEYKYLLQPKAAKTIDINKIINFDYDKRYLINYTKLYQYDEVIVDHFFKRGYIEDIASIFKTTKQNTAKQFSTHNISNLRNIEGTLLLMMKRGE